LLAKRVGARISITDLILARHVDDSIHCCFDGDEADYPPYFRWLTAHPSLPNNDICD
jgi:hypothetical protein